MTDEKFTGKAPPTTYLYGVTYTPKESELAGQFIVNPSIAPYKYWHEYPKHFHAVAEGKGIYSLIDDLEHQVPYDIVIVTQPLLERKDRKKLEIISKFAAKAIQGKVAMVWAASQPISARADATNMMQMEIYQDVFGGFGLVQLDEGQRIVAKKGSLTTVAYQDQFSPKEYLAALGALSQAEKHEKGEDTGETNSDKNMRYIKYGVGGTIAAIGLGVAYHYATKPKSA